jgi:hypothetical protein
MPVVLACRGSLAGAVRDAKLAPGGGPAVHHGPAASLIIGRSKERRQSDVGPTIDDIGRLTRWRVEASARLPFHDRHMRLSGANAKVPSLLAPLIE